MLKGLFKTVLTFCIFAAMLSTASKAMEQVEVQIAPFKTQISDIAVYNYGAEAIISFPRAITRAAIQGG